MENDFLGNSLLFKTIYYYTINITLALRPKFKNY